MLTEQLEGSLQHKVDVLKVSFLAFLYDGSHKCIQPISWLTSHRAGGRKPDESREAGGERGLDGIKERASQKSLYSVHTDGDKIGMSGSKERATVVEVC